MNRLYVGLRLLLALSALSLQASAFARPLRPVSSYRQTTPLFAEEGDKAGPLVTGEELAVLLQDLSLPLVIDAYATW